MEMTAEAWGALGTLIVTFGTVAVAWIQTERKKRRAEQEDSGEQSKKPEPATNTGSIPQIAPVVPLHPDPVQGVVAVALESITKILVDTQGTLHDVQNQLNETTRQLKESNRDLNDARRVNMEREVEIRTLQTKLSEVEAKLAAAHAEIRVLREQLGANAS